MSDPAFMVTNKLLSSFLLSAPQCFLPSIEEVYITTGQTIYESGEKITHIYFPQTARLSLVLLMSNYSTTEVISVGNEGMVGLPVIFGSETTTTSSIVQIPGTALKIPAKIIKEEFQKGEELHRLLLLYTQVQFSQISQIAVCRSHHEIEQRLARWLLTIYDGIQRNTLPLTQKFIAMMLGVRRASITEIAISFQKRGIIEYSRGQITIVNRAKLETISCECYGKIKSEYQRLM